jgi:hypothetical protein
VPFFLSQQAGDVDGFQLGQAGIGREVFSVGPVADMLAVELGCALKRDLDRFAANF